MNWSYKISVIQDLAILFTFFAFPLISKADPFTHLDPIKWQIYFKIGCSVFHEHFHRLCAYLVEFISKDVLLAGPTSLISFGGLVLGMGICCKSRGTRNIYLGFIMNTSACTIKALRTSRNPRTSVVSMFRSSCFVLFSLLNLTDSACRRTFLFNIYVVNSLLF